MKILIMGAAGFIGTNLAMELIKNSEDEITVLDEKREYFSNYPNDVMSRVRLIELPFSIETEFSQCMYNQDIVYYLISTNNPTTSNYDIGKELADNITIAIHVLEACIKAGVKKIIFLSSGGTVYGKDACCPIAESEKTQPINSYGLQKLTIEKLLYLYYHLYNLDYSIIRLSNPYGPYQRPDGKLGVITTFIYRALNNQKVKVFGDGTAVRDYIYISDAIHAIQNIAVSGNAKYHVYNVGSGKGTSINQIINYIIHELNMAVDVEYKDFRNVDVAVNYLDISRYEEEFGKLEQISLIEGMKKTMGFFEENRKRQGAVETNGYQ